MSRLMQLREMSKKQKLLIIVVVTIIALLAYANLLALNLISFSPLSMYDAVAAAAALTIVAVILSFVGKRKSVVPDPKGFVKSKIQTSETEESASSFVQPSVLFGRTARMPKFEIRSIDLKLEQPSLQPVKQPSIQPKEHPTPQIEKKPSASPIPKKPHTENPVPTPEPKETKNDTDPQTKQPDPQPVKPHPTQIKDEQTVQVEKKLAAEPAVIDVHIEKPVSSSLEKREMKNGKLKCQSCGKEFSQPILMADYGNPDQPDLVPHCPYCFKPLNAQLEFTTEEIAYKKYV
jgi:outer membrane biosynthesis protein TonB